MMLKNDKIGKDEIESEKQPAQPAKDELTDEQLDRVAGGVFFKNCCAGAHYKEVSL
jgi:hypothetical protein